MAIPGDRDVDGTILPRPSPPSGSVAGRTMQESMYSPRLATSRLPDDAPNTLIIANQHTQPVVGGSGRG